MSLKVSIIIPVYNGSNYLREAIDSALAQTYKNIEIIVINDGSNDKGATEKIAKSYGNKIRYFKKANGGVATALNLGIKKMTGEYFSWLSHDDVYKPFKIKKQISYLSKLKDKRVILYSDYDLMGSKGEFINHCIQDHRLLEKVPIYSLLRGMMNGITMLVPKSAFDKYGDFDTSLRCTQDYDMWHKMFVGYKFIHQEEILAVTRIHPNRDTVASPVMLTEGNMLWPRMLKGMPNSEKIAAEGSLIKFYLEMTKFLSQTPYKGALEYCQDELEAVVQSEDVGAEISYDKDKVIEIYESLTREDQKKAAAYYIENIIKRMVKNRKVGLAAYLLNEKLIGNSAGISIKYIQDEYLSKISKKTNKKRLMFCSGYWLTGGMERTLSIVFEQLKNEYELYLLTPYDGNQGQVKLPDYVTHIKISKNSFDNSYDYTTLSFAFIFDIDVAIGFMNLFYGQQDFYTLCVGTSIKTVASNHEMYFYPYMSPNHYGLVQKRLDSLKNVDAVLWETNFSATAYGLINDNSYLLANPNTYTVQKGINGGKKKNILCVGRFNDYVKRIDRILNCFNVVLKQEPDAKLMLVGKCDRTVPIRPSDNASFDDLLKEYKIDESKIIFIGEVNNVEKYYKQARLLLVASDSEGFGLVINEAASFGVPVVCNKIPGLEDIIIDGKNGFLTDQDDIKSMAKLVVELLSDNELRIRMSKTAQKLVARFDAVEIGNKWKYLIETLLQNDSYKITQSKLNKQLRYRCDDYKEFSKVLFGLMNKAATTSNDYTNNLSVSLAFNNQPRIKRYVKVLKNSIKTKGILQTNKIIVKKIHRRIKS